jgi:Flp pilus assembly protein TadG
MTMVENRSMILVSLLRHFLRQDRGNVAIISAFSFLPLLVLAGGATDIARHESYRVQLQDGVDRAVLAAASLTQTRPVEETIKDYLKSVPFIDQVELEFVPETTTNSRRVTVSASYVMQTGFLPLIGIDTMVVRAHGTAVERRSKIEMSLILDFSGSMAGSKYNALKTAATQFVQTMVTEQSKAYTTMSIVPYAGQVNVGYTIFNGVGGARTHHDSSCFELRAGDFGTGMIDLKNRLQVPQFTRWNSGSNLAKDLNPGWCPSEDTSIAYLSNDASYLVNRIANYKMYDGTGSAIGMRYGFMLLDPAVRPLVAQAAAHGAMNAAAMGRPADFDDPDTLKVIVLMTDGVITEQYTAKDPTKVVNAPNNYKMLVDPITNQEQTSARTRLLLAKMCTAAKTNDVLVFTIGFQISNNSDASRDMRDCASDPAYYYDVAGLNIAAAFESIATTIHRIKLTQ